MRKIVFLLSVFIVFNLIIGCNSKELQNQWTDQPIEINGDYSDWENIDLQYFEKPNMVMGSANDAENLYLMFRFTDQKLARKIQMMGVTFWLDKSGKKEKKYGIQYTGSIDLHVNFRPEKRSPEKISYEMKERREKFRDRFRTNLPGPGKIKVIENSEETELSENQTQGPAAGSAIHNGFFCYELRMPIPISTELGDKISLCMELGGIDQDKLSEMMPRRGFGGTPGGGIGRPPGDGMGGPPGGGMGDDRGMRGQRPDRQDLVRQEIWMKIVLARSLK